MLYTNMGNKMTTSDAIGFNMKLNALLKREKFKQDYLKKLRNSKSEIDQMVYRAMKRDGVI